jgi:hypothetical protein
MGIIRKEGRTLKKVTTSVERQSQSLVSLQNEINSITRYEFTATEGQTDFDIGDALVLPVVFYNGSIQSSDIYTFSGSILTLSEGVEAGANIQIINLK